jgi:MFS family permease
MVIISTPAADKVMASDNGVLSTRKERNMSISKKSRQSPKRQSLGLFVSPIHDSTGMGVAAISLALAVGQFAWGAIQPLAGALADRHGPRGVLWVGVLTLALGCALTPWASSGFGLTVTLGLLAAMGSGVGSFSVLIGAAAQQLPAQARGAASGVINAGGSFGQFIFAPILQGLIQRLGWMGAMWGMAAMTLLALPMVGRLTRGYQPPPAPSAAEGGVLRAIRTAMADRSYLLLHLGFFTCGFHIAFLVTHLPGEVNLCGLPPSVASWSLAIIGLSNIVGSLYAGACVSRYRSKYVLAVMYGSRALLIALYLMASPPSQAPRKPPVWCDNKVRPNSVPR